MILICPGYYFMVHVGNTRRRKMKNFETMNERKGESSQSLAELWA